MVLPFGDNLKAPGPEFDEAHHDHRFQGEVGDGLVVVGIREG